MPEKKQRTLLKKDLWDLLKEGKNIALLDFKDWLFSNDVFGGNAQADTLKKWIRYTAVDYGDADIVLKSGEILGKLGWNTRWLDCIWSFKTYFNAFLRFYLENMETYGYLLDHYDNIFSQAEKERFAEEKGIDIQLLNNLFEELNRFARNTHTIGNYMPCPDGQYNPIKGFGLGYKYFQDRLDLLYDELFQSKYSDYLKLNEKREYYKKWLNDEKEKLHIENLLNKLDYVCEAEKRYHRCVMKDEDDLRNFLEYLKKVNPLIEMRGLIIEKELKEKMEEK